MDQVQGVGNIAEALQRCRGEQAVHAPAAISATGHDDERTGEHGPQSQVAGESSFNRQDGAAGNQADDADPAHHDACAFGCLPFEGEHSEQGADSKFPETGAGIEVGKTLVAIGLNDGERQGGNKDRVEDEDRGREEVPTVSVHKVGDGGKKQGPNNEDLPLDGKRPEVLEG